MKRRATFLNVFLLLTLSASLLSFSAAAAQIKPKELPHKPKAKPTPPPHPRNAPDGHRRGVIQTPPPPVPAPTPKPRPAPPSGRAAQPHRMVEPAIPPNPTPHAAPRHPILVGPPNLITVPGEANLLRQAYGLLFRADHDYLGHRARAMRHIAAAAKMLGVHLGGDGRAGETQAESDAQLRQGRALLEQARSHTGGNSKVLAQINAAIKEINIALTIR